MKNAATLSGMLTALIVLASPAAMAAKGHLKQCVNRAINGPKIEHRQIGGHTFHCKPVKRVEVSKGVTRVTGTLVHEHLGPDDKVQFTFVTRNGELEKGSLRRKVSKGFGPGDLFPKLETLLKEIPIPFVPRFVSDQGIETGMEKLEKELAGPWESTAKKIVDLIVNKEVLRSRGA